MDKKQEAVKKHIIKKYGKFALSNTSCCEGSPTSCCSSQDQDRVALTEKIGYSRGDIEDAPDGANLNLGCGNPQVFAALKPGEVVLDLGSGAGFDCFLAARKVGTKGKVLGIDMTPEMVRKAKRNAITGSITNTYFQLGEIERLPLTNNCVDVIISNCVINLSTEKSLVFQEAFRVLKPGGRLAISDVIALTELPYEIKNDLDLYSACFSGAMEHNKLVKLLEDVGFSEITLDFDKKGQDVTQTWSQKIDPGDFIRSASISAVKNH